jgi:formate/nitrite transporter
MQSVPTPSTKDLSEAAGVRKVTTRPLTTFILGMLAGAFIAFGAYFALVVGTGGAQAWYGGVQFLKGIAFSLGLGLVIAGGAELFTGNILIVMAYASRKVTLTQMLRNWGIVFTGNLVGAVSTAGLLVLTGLYVSAHGELGKTALEVASAKSALLPLEAFVRGVLCNIMVCVAIWVSLTTRTIGGKTAAFTLPIAMFVASGFEHVVANMFFLPYAYLLHVWDPVFVSQFTILAPTLGAIGSNLFYVALGNMVGGGLFVGMVYWMLYKYLPKNS